MAERKARDDHSLNAQTVHELLLEIRQQNLWMRRYLFVFGAALALLLMMQFPTILSLLQQVLQIVVVVAIVLAVLLTAPMWSKLVGALTDRIPWWKRQT